MILFPKPFHHDTKTTHGTMFWLHRLPGSTESGDVEKTNASMDVVVRPRLVLPGVDSHIFDDFHPDPWGR